MLESSYFPVVYSDLMSLFVLSFETVCNLFDQSYVLPKPNFQHFSNQWMFCHKNQSNDLHWLNYFLHLSTSFDHQP